MASDGGKGSGRRPPCVSHDEFSNNWDAIFGKKEASLSDDFESKIDKTDDCWEWKGWKDKDGYGGLSYKGVTYKAHRVSYELYSGIAPGDKCVCHSCDNPSCVNPDHLWLGTQKENVHDMIAKGRRVLLKGKDSFSYDHTIYTFIHKSGEKFTGTQYDFKMKYDIDGRNLANVLNPNDRHQSIKGWKLYEKVSP